MNRTIKFRMWNCVKSDPSKSKMFYDLVQVMECLKQQVLFDNKSNPRFDIEYNHVGDGTVFMQFTGLLDKNGKEIYDGDIRRATYFCQSEQCEHIAVMEWNSNLNGWVWVAVRGYWDEWMGTEVIGNIYETPNLINP